MPNIFFIFFVSLLSATQHLTLVVVCDSSFCYVYYHCMSVKSHTFIFLVLLGLDNVFFCLLMVAH